MQPENASAAFQETLARAVRQGSADADANTPLDAERLAVYARLVRNNINGFIQRCYPQAARYADPEQWAAAKEAFVAEGSAHSPYFQDIPGEFLAFCRQGRAAFRLPEHILQLMRFEHSQLVAEIAATPPNAAFEWDEDTPFVLSPVAGIADYPFNVCADEPDFQAAPTTVAVWQDAGGSVYHSPLDEIDRILLQAAAQSPLSQAQICESLAGVSEQAAQWQPEIERRWQQWVDADVLLPAERSA
jgi:hypothetical protein